VNIILDSCLFKGLLKEIVREGINDDKPLFDDQVFIHYVGSEFDGTIFVNSRERDEKFSFSLGKKEVIPAWDIGVSTMKRGEIARFLSTPKYAYGLKGEKKISICYKCHL
jgi:FKBP-type peptidyl-prolyl cis-trans isomerase